MSKLYVSNFILNGLNVPKIKCMSMKLRQKKGFEHKSKILVYSEMIPVFVFRHFENDQKNIFRDELERVDFCFFIPYNIKNYHAKFHASTPKCSHGGIF